MLNHVDLAEQLVVAKEQVMRRHETPNSEALLKDLTAKARVMFILNRLTVAEYNFESKTMIMEMTATYRDVEDGAADTFVCGRPEGLSPFASVHHCPLMLEIIFLFIIIVFLFITLFF